MNQELQLKIHTLAEDLRAVADALEIISRDPETKPDTVDRVARMGVQTVAYALKDLAGEMKYADLRRAP